MANFAEFSLFVATPEQIQESRKRSHASWARGLSMEAYLKRDNVMDLEEHAADGKLITWVLAPRNDPTTIDFKCSCETYRRIGILASPSSTSVTDKPCYGIASVFTPPQHRGHGYASFMMSLLHWVLSPRSSLPEEFPAQWGAPPSSHLQDGLFSVLYSDVGSTFYARCGPAPSPERHTGWVTKSPVSTQWDVPAFLAGSFRSPPCRWLSRAECADIWNRDTQLLKADAVALAKAKGKTVFAFLPNNGVGPFSIQRLMTFDENLNPVYPPEPWGIELPDQKELTFATWTLEPGTKTMVLTRMRASGENFMTLMGALSSKAAELGFDTIEAWNLPKELEQVSLRNRAFGRDEHLSAVKWYGQENEDEVEWVFNEKFCWC